MGFFVGFGVATLLEDNVSGSGRMFGLFGGGVLIAAIDIAVRRIFGTGDGWERYGRAPTGPAVGPVPAWAFGLLFVVAGVALK